MRRRLPTTGGTQLQLAGGEPDTYDADLAEWDYGAEEGRTTAEARESGRPGWTVFDGVPPGIL